MALIKTTTELKQYLPFAITFKIEDILPFIKQIENDIIIPMVSKTEYTALHSAYNAGSPALTADQTNLLDRIRSVITPFAVLKWVPWGQVQVNQSGIQIVSNENMKTAFSWQVQDLKNSAEMSGYSALESLFNLLSDNKAIYTLWAASAERNFLLRNFINSSSEFNKYFNISSNRKTFDRLRDVITNIEKNIIKPVVCDALFDEIKSQILSNSISANNEKLMAFIRPAVCYLSIAKGVATLPFSFDDENALSINSNSTGNAKADSPLTVFYKDKLSVLKAECQRDGLNEVEKLRQYLYDNISTYTLFADSDCYNSDSSSSQVDNADGSGIYFT